MADVVRARIGRKVLEVRPSLLDRAIAYVSPAAGIRRMHAQITGAYLKGGGYTTRDKKRQLSQWQASDGDADEDLLVDLEDLRATSGDLFRKNAIAAGAIKTKLTSVIGEGLKLNAAIDREFLELDDAKADEIELALQREWDLFAATAECDVERQSNFAQLTRIVYLGMLQRGDIFATLPMIERAGSPFETKIQLIEADRFCNPSFNTDTDEIAGGIERSKSGEFIAIHVTNKHPGSTKGRADNRQAAKDFEWSRVAAFGAESGTRFVLHVFDKLRPGQSRGVPDLAAVIEPIKQLGRYTEAEIAAAVVSGMFTVFIKSTSGAQLQPMQPTAESGASDADQDIKLMNGGIVGLMPGEDIEAPNPGRPNDKFDPFVKSILMQIGMALELPYELLVKLFSSSYSGARASINEAWKYFITQRALIRDGWCQPVYESVIEEAVLKGRIDLPGFLQDPARRHAFLGASWVGPGRGQINEVQEVEAAVMRVDNNLSTKAQETAAINGGDFESNVRTRRREMAAERDLMQEQKALKESTPQPGNGGDEDEDDQDGDEPALPEPKETPND